MCHLQIHNIKTRTAPLNKNPSIFFLGDFPYPHHPFTKIGHSGELLASAILSFKIKRVTGTCAVQGVREVSYKRGPELAENIWTGGSQNGV